MNNQPEVTETATVASGDTTPFKTLYFNMRQTGVILVCYDKSRKCSAMWPQLKAAEHRPCQRVVLPRLPRTGTLTWAPSHSSVAAVCGRR